MFYRCFLPLKRVLYLLIFGAFLLLLALLFVLRPLRPPQELVRVKRVPTSGVRSGIAIRVIDFDAEKMAGRTHCVLPLSPTYDRTIIDNNLFRPLGWTPPRPIEPYRLLGTKLARDANIPPQAIVQTVTTNMTHIVILGSNLDVDTQVVDIQSKQVTLSTHGQQRTLMLPSGF